MGIAADAVADLAGPPPPRAAASAADDRHTPSFQDRLDASDRAKPRAEKPGDGRAQATQTKSNDQANNQSSNQSSETSAPAGRAQEDHADRDADAVNPPIFVQLIAHAASPMVAAKADQTPPPQRQERPQLTSAEQAAAQLSSAQLSGAQLSGAQASSAQMGGAHASGAQPSNAQVDSPEVNSAEASSAAALANATAPIKVAPKADPRPGQAKTAKGGGEKTQAWSATPSANAAPEGAASASQQQAAAPLTLANLAAQDPTKNRSDANSAVLEGVRAQPLNAGPTSAPRQASPPAQAPLPGPQALASAMSPSAKPRDEGKAPALADALQQAGQDFAQGPPKAQPAPSMQPVSAHPQLAILVEQGAASAADARTRAAPVAAQVSGEIIRRFTGTDTSFQLRLDPPDLGRVDVRLDVSRDHRVTAIISADSPQALSDLARGARDLQLALQSAGLDLADDGLRFDLSSNGQGNGFAQAQAEPDQSGFRAANAAQAPAIAPEIAAQRPLSIDRWRGARVDLMA